MQKFRYGADPLCVASWVAYALNRWIGIPLYGAQVPFLRAYFNDALLIPAALPPLLWLRRRLRLFCGNAG